MGHCCNVEADGRHVCFYLIYLAAVDKYGISTHTKLER